MPEVSVILPTRDRPHLLGRALQSLLTQSFTDFEVLLIDGNRMTPPTTKNPEICELLRDPRVRVIEAGSASSPASARNLGLSAIRGNWVTFLDDDDEYRSEKLAAQHALANATGAPLVLCGYEFVWPHRRRVRQTDREWFRGDELLTHAFLGTPVLFHRRGDFLRFDERLAAGEDMPYALRIIVHHRLERAPCVPNALVIVYPQPHGRSVHSDKEAAWRGYRAAWLLARGRFSRPARRSFLAQGRLERAIGGHAGTAHFLRCVLAVLRTHGVRAWRFALYAVVARAQRRLPRQRQSAPVVENTRNR